MIIIKKNSYYIVYTEQYCCLLVAGLMCFPAVAVDHVCSGKKTFQFNSLEQ